jgi:hypothetical protein
LRFGSAAIVPGCETQVRHLFVDCEAGIIADLGSGKLEGLVTRGIVHEDDVEIRKRLCL